MNDLINHSNDSTNLTDKAYNTIKKQIINGELEQGQIISISAMSKQLNISRTPITNACQKLENENFLTIIPRHGVVINTLSLTDAREIYELRTMLETFLAQKSFDKFDDNDIEYLESSYNRQVNAIEHADIKEFMKEDMDFHKYILKKGNNSEVMTIIENVFDRAYLLGIESCKDPNRLKQNIDEHANIIKALKEGSVDDFVKYIELNILNGLSSLINQNIL